MVLKFYQLKKNYIKERNKAFRALFDIHNPNLLILISTVHLGTFDDKWLNSSFQCFLQGRISSKDKLNLWISKRSRLSIDFDIHTGVCGYEMIFEVLGEKIKIEHLIKFFFQTFCKPNLLMEKKWMSEGGGGKDFLRRLTPL